MKPTPKKPRIIIAQVEDSGTAVMTRGSPATAPVPRLGPMRSAAKTKAYVQKILSVMPVIANPVRFKLFKSGIQPNIRGESRLGQAEELEVCSGRDSYKLADQRHKTCRGLVSST